MLTEKEEQHLIELIELAKLDIIEDRYAKLAEKLIEINNEAAKYAEELEKANREYVFHRERCEGL